MPEPGRKADKMPAFEAGPVLPQNYLVSLQAADLCGGINSQHADQQQ